MKPFNGDCRQAGFSLIEMAVVLLVMGVLMGGVMKGMDMVESAKYKKLIELDDTLEGALLAYQDKYRRLPGDDSKVADFLGLTSEDAGSGNGSLSGDFDDTDEDVESRKLWQHLRAADLMNGATAGDMAREIPQHAWDDSVGFESDRFGLKGLVLCFRDLPGEWAQKFDVERDDGNATTGRVQSGASDTVTAYDRESETTLCRKI